MPANPLIDIGPGGVDNPEHRAIATQGLALLGHVGSTAHGLHLAGQDDRDEMGVCIEPREYVVGLEGWQQDSRRFQQWNYRTQPDGHRSGPGDLDLVVYSLRKYCWLASRGNPTILILLFVEPLYATDVGADLQGSAEIFASTSAGHRYLRYMQAHHTRLMNADPNKSTRPELIEAHGFDTKLAMHVLRLGFQGTEYMRTGRLTLPMQGEERDFCFAVRKGEVALPEIVKRAEAAQQQLTDLIHGGSPLPDLPDEVAINALLVRGYERGWR